MMLLQAIVVLLVFLISWNLIRMHLRRKRRKQIMSILCPVVERPKMMHAEVAAEKMNNDGSCILPGEILKMDQSDTSELPSKETMRHIKKIKAKSKRRSSKRVNKNKKLYNKSKK